MTTGLKGKRALVTAGAQGIGLAISRALGAAGCDIFVHYRSSADAADTLRAELREGGVRAESGSGDLTSRGDCDRIVAEAVEALGGLDILVNNAGSLVGRRSFEAIDDEFWASVMRLNVDSARWVTHAALPHLVEAAGTRGGASIVNLSSVAGRHGGGPGAIAYSTAKGAMLTLTRGLATEYGPRGVRVNAVTPGLILGSAFHQQHTPEEMQKRIISGIPLGRAGTTEDVARAVVFLAGELDGFITGATLDINGGVYLM
jgi:3-oxoacyl-[acyl-carrier protein] reductase